MKWAEFECPKCGYRTSQPASSTVSHVCPADGVDRALKKL